MSTSADPALCRDGTQLSFGQNLLIGDITPEYDRINPCFEPVDSSKTC